MNTSHWISVNSFILQCVERKDIDDYMSFAIQELSKLIPYDNGVALYYQSGVERPAKIQTFNFKERWILPWQNYFSSFESLKDLVPKRLQHHSIGSTVSYLVWPALPKDEITKEYIRKLGLIHSFVISLKGPQSTARVVLVCNRLRDVPFTPLEKELLDVLIPHLGNIALKFARHVKGSPEQARVQAILDVAGLTKQEQNIVLHLCKGASISEVSDLLCISITTTRKHLTHIYKKLQVSNIQGMLVRLLNI